MGVFLIGGLAAIFVLSVVERVRERPRSDWSGVFASRVWFPETDLQVEGLARSGDVRLAVAMYQRLHKADYKRAQRAVMLLAAGEREQAAAMGKAGPGLIPRGAAPQRQAGLGQLATGLSALHAEAGKRRQGRRR